MAEVVDLFAALPPRALDTRLMVLRREFGVRPFKVGQVAALLNVDVAAAFDLCVNEPLADDLSRIVASGEGGFRLQVVPPAQAALPRWRRLYLPIMRTLGEFTAPTFARAAFVPVATATFLCTEFHKAGLLARPHFRSTEEHARFVVRRRRVIWGVPQEDDFRYPRRKIIWRKPILPAFLNEARIVYPAE